jgi:hypothetical protein
MQHNFDTKFIVKQGPFVTDREQIFVVSVYDLLELTDEIIHQGKKCGDKKLVIEPHKWNDIASIYLNEEHFHLLTLLNMGATVIENSEVFNTEVDARVQQALVCAKNLVEQDDVYHMTGCQMDSQTYATLVEMLYEYLPEKLV